MKLEVNKTYVTRDGRHVKILSLENNHFRYKAVGTFVSDDDQNVSCNTWCLDGSFANSTLFYGSDLVSEYKPPEIHTRVITWYRSASGNVHSHMGYSLDDFVNSYAHLPQILKTETVTYEEK